MSVILILIPLSIVFAVGFLAAFIWAVRTGQFEDTCTPSMRVLSEEATSRAAIARPGRIVTGQPAPARDNADSTGGQIIAISEKPVPTADSSMPPL